MKMEEWRVLVQQGKFDLLSEREEIHVHIRAPGLFPDKDYVNIFFAVPAGEYLLDIEEWQDVVWEVIHLREGEGYFWDSGKLTAHLRQWILSDDNEHKLQLAWAQHTLPRLQSQAMRLAKNIARLEALLKEEEAMQEVER